MTVEELKAALLGKEYPDNIRIAPHMVVLNAANFLQVQFLECELWKKDIEKCPAYLRLVRFYEVTSQLRE